MNNFHTIIRTLLIAWALLISLFAHAQLGTESPSTSKPLDEHLDTTYVLNCITNGGDYQNTSLDSALYFAEEALRVAEKLKFGKGEVASLNLTGVVFIKLGNYSKGLKLFLEALRIGETIDYPKGKAMVFTNLGDLYFKQGELRRALDYTFQAKAIAESLGLNENICANLINLGNYYESINQLDSALINTQLAYALAQKIKDDNYIGITLNNLGNINLKSKQYTLALEYYRLSFEYFKRTEDYDGLCESYLGTAKVFRDLAKPDSALFYSKKTYSTAVNQGFTKFIFDASSFIAAHYETAQNIDSAFSYQKIMIAAKDSLFSQEKVKQIQNMTINETARQHELQQERLKAEEERLHNLQYILIATFIFFFALVILLFSRRFIKATTVNFMVTVGLLLLFEFITLLIHPTIAEWTHHSPVFMLLILVVIAAILVPMHHRLEHWIKETLAHKIIQPKTRKIKTHISDQG